MNQPINKRFISFEGIDFSGKSTQVKLVQDYLKKHGHRVYVLREPGGTKISEKIRALLLDKTHNHMSDICEIFLYSAARTQLVTEKIIPLLKQGSFVIADRYVDSTTAYQGYGRNIDAEMVHQINQAAIRGLMPSLTFFIDIPAPVSYQRRSASGRETDRLEEAGKSFFERVYQGYHKLASQNKDRIQVLDGQLDKKEIHQLIIQTLQNGEKI